MRPAQPERLNLLELLPHRYPFLLIDQVLEVDPGVRVVCIKNVTMNDWFFQGHYPDHPVMPGMLILEAMAQAGGILTLSSSLQSDGLVAYFMGAERVKFRRPVHPGNQLRIEATMLKSRRSVYRFCAEASVDGQLATEADVTVAIR
jgi:3-hydroxyacyl-[acyl-carrier-protein] dehydratase